MADSIIKELQVPESSAPMILVIGQTGAGKAAEVVVQRRACADRPEGKSHFINKVVGEKVVKESARLYSCTSHPELVEATVDKHEFFMVDTPGFNDTWRDSQRSDARILSEIARTLTLQTQLGVQLRGILYLYDISASRMTGDTLRQLEMIKRICGEANYSNVMLVTTHWPKQVAEQKERGCPIREADLRREFWKDMIQGGSKMWRFDDEHATAKAIVRSLAGKPNITLALQDEMAKGKSLSKTTAGSFIVNARHKDEERLKAKEKEVVSNPGEIKELQESIENRKAAEAKLQDDLVARIRKEIETIDEEARKRNKKPTVASILQWLIGISELTVQAVQTAFTIMA
jgi:hypothetical protein